jgi:hypothetical protein
VLFAMVKPLEADSCCNKACFTAIDFAVLMMNDLFFARLSKC